MTFSDSSFSAGGLFNKQTNKQTNGQKNGNRVMIFDPVLLRALLGKNNIARQSTRQKMKITTHIQGYSYIVGRFALAIHYNMFIEHIFKTSIARHQTHLKSMNYKKHFVL